MDTTTFRISKAYLFLEKSSLVRQSQTFFLVPSQVRMMLQTSSTNKLPPLRPLYRLLQQSLTHPSLTKLKHGIFLPFATYFDPSFSDINFIELQNLKKMKNSIRFCQPHLYLAEKDHVACRIMNAY